MDDETLKRIYEFLEWDVLPKYESPCEECGYFECEKNTLNIQDIIKKKYKWNDVDHKSCLKRNKEKHKKLMKVLRHPAFKKWSHEKCRICETKHFKHDMKLHTEIEEKPNDRGYFTVELFRLCNRCHKKYCRQKKPLHKGYRKI